MRSYRLAPELTDHERRMCTCGHLSEDHPADGECETCGCLTFEYSGETLFTCGHLPSYDPCKGITTPCLCAAASIMPLISCPLHRQPKPRRKPLPFRKVWDRDGWQCVKCGTHKNLTVDHVIPVSKGGTDDLGNLQTMCGSCNSRKGNRT